MEDIRPEMEEVRSSKGSRGSLMSNAHVPAPPPPPPASVHGELLSPFLHFAVSGGAEERRGHSPV